MRGRIQAWNAGSAEGVIQADNGDSISFEFSAVLAYDVAFLAVGRLVSFDLEGRDGSRAVNVCLHRLQPSPEGTPRHPASLRYVGFEHAEGIRSYKFERTPPGEEMKMRWSRSRQQHWWPQFTLVGAVLDFCPFVLR